LYSSLETEVLESRKFRITFESKRPSVARGRKPNREKLRSLFLLPNITRERTVEKESTLAGIGSTFPLENI
jgi:hypothetical protein